MALIFLTWVFMGFIYCFGLFYGHFANVLFGALVTLAFRFAWYYYLGVISLVDCVCRCAM